MSEKLRVVSPRDGSVLAERAAASETEIARVLRAAECAQESWRRVPVAERVAVLERGVDAFVARERGDREGDHSADGSPAARRSGRGARLRGAGAAHARDCGRLPRRRRPGAAKPGFERFIRREPLGIVLTIAPWNYPYLTAVNSVVPALAAGNAVILRHSEQTLLCCRADGQLPSPRPGCPPACCQALHCDHEAVSRLIASPEVAFVAFTGSVGGGRAIQRAASQRFIATGLELGGKDPAYVRADAPFEHSVESLVDGAFYNAGQSCCGIERIYVHEHLHDRFVEAFAAAVQEYRLGDPAGSGHDPRPARAHLGRRPRSGDSWPRPWDYGAQRSRGREPLRRGAARFALPRAPGAERGGSRHARHVGGELRAHRGDPARVQRRRGDPA